jgi:hypothetical protein
MWPPKVFNQSFQSDDSKRKCSFRSRGYCPSGQDVHIPRGNLLCFRMKIRPDLGKDSALEIVPEYPAD